MSELVIRDLLIWVVPVLLAITVHEAAHGYVARYFGDPTAEMAGRITINPLKHIDPFGTIILPLILFKFSGFVFGWAKPVPVNFSRLRHPKADMLWVAAAGPASNLAMAIGWALLWKLGAGSAPGSWLSGLVLMAEAGIRINGILMLLNLLPIPPLDGGRVTISLLPDRLAWKYARIEPFGFPILLILIVTGVLGIILGPLLDGFSFGLMTLFGR
jgi:Zn-dependent protease